MAQHNCSICGKDIAPANALGKCSLCAIGLAPTSKLHRDNTQIEFTGASGRTLSGSNCPACTAELSMADISRKNCSICGESFRPEAVEATVHIRQTANDITFPTFRTTQKNFS